jgi:hypothetical protein
MATFRYFYIGSRQVYIEISPQLASTLDESLDNLSVTEKANDIENPYTPFQRFYIKDENNNIIQTFIISNDNVELVTQNPARYKHHLTLVQESEYLTKHEIRNTVFSNSLESANFNLFFGTRFFFNLDTNSMKLNSANTSINLETKKPTKILFKPSFYACYQYSYIEYTKNVSEGGQVIVEKWLQYGVNQDYTIKKWSDLYKNNPNNVLYPTITFSIGNEQMDWQMSDFELDEEIEIPQNILSWIQSKTTGTLNISLSCFENLNGFVTTPNADVNCPIYGKLTFDVEVMSIETSVYDAIDTLLKQQMKETNDYNSLNDSDNIKPLFKLPTPSSNPNLYNLLKNTNTPNFVFTQCTMYDALVEIFKLFDAIFTIDNAGYLDIEYFNEQAQTPISQPNKAGQGRSLSEDRFTNKLITYFQNTKMEHKFPNSNDINATAYIRSKTLGVPAQSDFCFVVPKPIDIIKRVRIKTNFNIQEWQYVLSKEEPNIALFRENIVFSDINFNKIVDITPCIVESSLWSLLPATGSFVSPYNPICKENALTYERGSKVIDIGRYYNITTSTALKDRQQLILDNIYLYATLKSLGLQYASSLTSYTYTQTTDFADVKMAVEYIALVDGKLVNESLDNKYNGETLINQSNGSIDINKLGLNMVGLSLKLGQPTLNMTQVFTSWDNRVRKGQYFVDGNGDRWVANNCVYTVIKPNLVQTNIEFVKNFNGLAKRIELNNEKRLSNISNELTTKCEETYGEFIYYSSRLISANLREKIVMNNSYLVNAIPMGFGYYTTNTERIEYALINTYDENLTSYYYEGQRTQNIAIPLMVYGSGNSVSFEMSFDSPISAGNQLLNNYTSSLWDDGWFSRAVLYTDTDGTFNNCTIQFVKMDEELTRYFPKMWNGSRYLNFTEMGALVDFKYYKKPNEIFALNYQLHFLPISKSRDFLSNEYIKNNGFGNGLNNKQMFIRTSDNENIYSILDTKGEGDEPVAVSSVVSYPAQINFRLKLVFSANLPDGKWASCKSWAIVDKDNNIYFASNNPPSQSDDSSVTTNQFAIWFVARHHRLS